MPLHLGEHFQVSYVTPTIDKAATYLRETLGAAQLSDLRDLRGADGEQTLIQNLAHFQLGGTEIEVIEPREPWPGSIYLEDGWRDRRLLQFHHLGFLSETPDAWQAVVAEAGRLNIAIPLLMRTDSVFVAYLDLRDTQGHFAEAVYRAPGTGPGGSRQPDY